MKKAFIYFLSISFLLTMCGFHGVIAMAKEKSLPIGEMISKGKVQYEVRPNQWREVEGSHFMVFEGMKIRVEKGMSKIALSKGSQIEIQPNSLVIIEQGDRIILARGGVEFRIPSTSDLMFRVGNISIQKANILQASKDVLSLSRSDEEVIGSLNVHSNGALSIKSEKGQLTILDGNKKVLASLGSRDSITLPSRTINLPERTVVAQVGETGAAKGEEGFLGLSTWSWVGIAAAAAVIGGVIAIAAAGDEDHERAPVCP